MTKKFFIKKKTIQVMTNFIHCLHLQQQKERENRFEDE